MFPTVENIIAELSKEPPETLVKHSKQKGFPVEVPHHIQAVNLARTISLEPISVLDGKIGQVEVIATIDWIFEWQPLVYFASAGQNHFEVKIGEHPPTIISKNVGVIWRWLPSVNKFLNALRSHDQHAPRTA